MKPPYRVAFALMAMVVFCAILPIVFGYLFTPPRDAIYRMPGFACYCGYSEYFAFENDRMISWNIGHNHKQESDYMVATGQEGRFNLLNYDLKPSGSVQFVGHHIELQLGDKLPVNIPREWNCYRVWLDRFYGRNELYCYQSLEDTKKQIEEKKAQRADAPNSHAFGTFVTDPADAGSAPKASGSR